MKVAALYDIHGNHAALKAVLQEVMDEKIETVVIGGDLVWGPQPKEVMETLFQYKERFLFIKGNADREVVHRYGTEEGCPDFVADMNGWCADQLSEEHLIFLKNLPEKQIVPVNGLGEVLFVHGSPRSDEEPIRVNTPEHEVTEMIHNTTENVIVCGHTHIQFDRIVAGKRIVNAGSVGLQSRAKGACWLLMDGDIKYRITEYHVEQAAAEILNGTCPYKKDFADHLLNPPDVGP